MHISSYWLAVVGLIAVLRYYNSKVICYCYSRPEEASSDIYKAEIIISEVIKE